MILPETALQDTRYAARMLRRNLGFTAIAIVALAVGVGVNTTVFTAYKAMVARPLDARRPGDMVNLALVRDSGAADFLFSYLDYEAYRDSLRSFDSVIAFRGEQLTLSNLGARTGGRASSSESMAGRLGLLSSSASDAESASVFVVSENYFKTLGVAPLRGLSFESMSAS